MIESSYSDISDEDLASLIEDSRQVNASVGVSMATGLLRARGIVVQRIRVRRALQLSDPLSDVLKWPGLLTKRHSYSVAGPNSLWHMHVGQFL